MGMLLNDVMVSVPQSAKSKLMTAFLFVFVLIAERRAAVLRRKCNVLTSDKTPEAITDRVNQVRMEEPTPSLRNHWLVQGEKEQPRGQNLSSAIRMEDRREGIGETHKNEMHRGHPP